MKILPRLSNTVHCDRAAAVSDFRQDPGLHDLKAGQCFRQQSGPIFCLCAAATEQAVEQTLQRTHRAGPADASLNRSALFRTFGIHWLIANQAIQIFSRVLPAAGSRLFNDFIQ